MEQHKKKKKLSLLVICICLLLCRIGGTLAYLIAQAEKHNTLTAGETEVDIEEDFVPPEELKPGTEFIKSPRVRNTGALDCFVRVRVDFTHPKAEQFCELLDFSSKWTDRQPDGYYYYKEMVPSGASTESLFNKVKVSDTITVDDLVEFEILIYAEAVEHKRHEGTCAPDEYLDAWDAYKGGDGV